MMRRKAGRGSPERSEMSRRRTHDFQFKVRNIERFLKEETNQMDHRFQGKELASS